MRSIVQKMKVSLILVLIVSMLSISALADFEAAVVNKKMKVYFAPTTASEQIGSLKQGTVVTVEAHQNGWARINYKNRIGFAKIEDMVSSLYTKAKVSHAALIYYITPDNTNPRWGALNKGTTVYIRGQRDQYYLVSNRDFTVLAYIEKSKVK